MKGRYAIVRVGWDDEAKVWFVEESDIDGLAAEAASLDLLRAKIPGIVHDLLADVEGRPDEIEVDLIVYARDRIRLAA
jgi:hypothetical protein